MKKILTITSCSFLSLALNISEVKASDSSLHNNMYKLCQKELYLGIFQHANALHGQKKISDETFHKIEKELKELKELFDKNTKKIEFYHKNGAQISKDPKLLEHIINNLTIHTVEMCKVNLEKFNKLLEVEIARTEGYDIKNTPWYRMRQECGVNSFYVLGDASRIKKKGYLSDEIFNKIEKDLGGQEAIHSAFKSASDLKKNLANNLAASTVESNAKKCKEAVDKVKKLLNGIMKSAHERSLKEFDAMKLEISEKVSRFKKEGKISDETFNIIVKKIEHLTEEARRSYGPGFLSAHKGTFEEIDEILKTESANSGGDKTPCARPIFINTIDGAFTCLGLSPNASWDEVDTAYNKLLKSELYHSLSEAAKKQRLEKLGKAYKILKFQKFNLGPKFRGDF